jgi:hypothetical protein
MAKKRKKMEAMKEERRKMKAEELGICDRMAEI